MVFFYDVALGLVLALPVGLLLHWSGLPTGYPGVILVLAALVAGLLGPWIRRLGAWPGCAVWGALGGAVVAKTTELLLPPNLPGDDPVLLGILGGVVVGPSWALALRMLSRMYAEVDS